MCSQYLVKVVMWILVYLIIFCSSKYKHGGFAKNVLSYGMLAITNVRFDVSTWNLA